MAQIVKLRRSSVSGQKPTNSNLQLGELALNTTDGKVFMAVSGSGGPSVEELILTNTINTGSVNISGSINLIGHQTVTGSLIVTDGVGYINTGLIAENSDLLLTSGSNVYIQDGGIVSASALQGDGSGIINIPLSGVTNLVTVSSSLDSRLDYLETLSQSYSGSLFADYIDFNTSSNAPTQSGRLRWNADEGTLSFGENESGVESFINQQLDYPLIFNDDSVNLIRGTLVMVNPLDVSQGDKLNIIRANSDGTYPSKLIVGVLKEDVAVGETGIVQWFGKLKNVSVPTLESNNIKFSGETWFEGSILYADPTRLGGLTNVEPTAPNLKVTIAVVTRIVGNNITLLIRPLLNQNIEELNNVNSDNLTFGDLLMRSGSVWMNTKQLNGSYGLTGSLEISGSQTIKGQQVVSGSVYITEDLIVLGSSSLQNITASSVDIGANTVNLNTYLPSIRYGGINVFDSGSSGVSASLLWDSQTDNWVFVHEPTGGPIDSSYLIYGPLSQGGVGSEDLLVGNYLTKVEDNGHGHHLTTSSIFDGSSKVSINNDTEITGSLTVTGGLNGTLDYSFITNPPTLVSGSSQIEITGTTGYSTFSSSISDSLINVSTSLSTSLSELTDNLNTFTSSTDNTLNNVDGRLDSLETESGSIRSDFNTFTSSYTTSSFTGSFIGDGSGLTNLPNITGSANQVAILDSDKTVTSSWFTHVTNQTFGIGTDAVTIDQPERLMVDNFNSWNIATFQTSQQETYAEVNIKNFGSGSNSSTDLVIWNDETTEETSYLDLGINSSNYTGGYVGYQNDSYLFSHTDDLYIGAMGSGSLDHGHVHIFGGGKWDSSSISIYVDGTIGINTDQDDPNALTIPSSTDGFAVEISGSVKFRNDVYVQGTITAEEFHTTYVTSSVLYQSGSTKFGDTEDDLHQFTGSVDITGSLYLNGTPVGTGKLDETIFNNYTSSNDDRVDTLETESGSIRSNFNTFTSSYVTDSGSFDNRINEITGSIDSINTFTSSVVLTSETSSMTVLSSSYAVTASYALAVLGGGAEGRTARFEEVVPSTTWTFNHYLGERYPAIEVYDNNGFVVIPSSIEAVSDSQLIVTFPSNQTGVITATVGGGLPSGYSNGDFLTIQNGDPSWVNPTTTGYAITGSNTFSDDQTITGTLTVDDVIINDTLTLTDSLIKQCTLTGVTSNTLVCSFNMATYDGAFFDYVIKNGSNLRAGTVMSVWDGVNTVFTETTTNDLGDTSMVGMSVVIDSTNVGLQSTISSGTWTIKVLARGL